jgi:hypothetical protein
MVEMALQTQDQVVVHVCMVDGHPIPEMAVLVLSSSDTLTLKQLLLVLV